MAFLGKEYTLDRDENFDTFLKSAGFPDDQIKGYMLMKPTCKLVKDGDTYTYIAGHGGGFKETKFKSGVEFSDTMQDIPIKTTITVNGNIIDQLIKSDKGDAMVKREFKGDEIIVTITSTVWDGVAKRYYKA